MHVYSHVNVNGGPKYTPHHTAKHSTGASINPGLKCYGLSVLLSKTWRIKCSANDDDDDDDDDDHENCTRKLKKMVICHP